MKKRFYKDATISDDLDGNGYCVLLDGKKIMTPAGEPFLLPTSVLADAIASEWNAQLDEIKPTTMPLTQIAGTAIDRVSKTREDVIDGLLKYAGTDLLCHLAENPPELVERQQAKWQPLLDWAASELGARLIPTNGIIAKTQSDDAISALRQEIEKIDTHNLTALAVLVGTCGSIVLGLALYHKHINAQTVFDCSMLDNTWQAENWGEDWEAKERAELVMAEIKDIEKFFELLREA